MLVQVELKILCTGNFPLQVNIAAGRLVSLMYVLEHFWSLLPWYYDSISANNES